MTPDGPKILQKSPPPDYTKTCPLTVHAAGGELKASAANAWTFSHKMTPEILKVVRGEQGGGHVVILGSGFKPDEPHRGDAHIPIYGEAYETKAQPQPIVEVGGVPCVISLVTAEKLECTDSVAPPEGAIVTVYVPGRGDAVPAAPDVETMPPLPPPADPGFPRPVPTVLPNKAIFLKSHVEARCRFEHALIDCPGGWKCCRDRKVPPTPGILEAKTNPAVPGICAPLCLSFLQRSK